MVFSSSSLPFILVGSLVICSLGHSQSPAVNKGKTGASAGKSTAAGELVVPTTPITQPRLNMPKVITPRKGDGVLPILPQSSAQLPRVFAPTKPDNASTIYPWKTDITATIFWIGEQAAENNPVPNDKSSWDGKWQENYGGVDTPDAGERTYEFIPKKFVPGQNPFYIALPYNDITGSGTKAEAKLMIPWFKKRTPGPGGTVCKGQWLALRYGGRVCYAQWEDCGPFQTNDFAYVFGMARPGNQNNGAAGIDISPAIRDYLGMRSGDRCDWRFVEVNEVPEGPWTNMGRTTILCRPASSKRQAATSWIWRNCGGKGMSGSRKTGPA